MQTDDDAQTLNDVKFVADARAQELRSMGIVNARQLATAAPAEVYAQTEMSKYDVKKVIGAARALFDDLSDEVPSFDETDDEDIEGPQVPSGYGKSREMASESAESTADDEMPEKYKPDNEKAKITTFDDEWDSEPTPEPEDVQKVAILAGDGIFDRGELLGHLTREQQATLVEQRLSEAGIDREQLTHIGVNDSGHGKEAVQAWWSMHKERGNAVPTPNEFEPTSYDREGFEDRDEALIEWADALVLVANGQYVGRQMSLARENNKYRYSPTDDEDEEMAETFRQMNETGDDEE